MLLQLLTNARTHAHGTLRVEAAVFLCDDRKRLRFAVRDYGVGVSQRSGSTLFEKFG